MFRRHERQQEREYWQWLVGGAAQWASEPTLIIGDLNVDPSRQNWRAAELHRFESSGWQIADPTGEWSYWASDAHNSRIDHAVATRDVTIHSADYRPQVGSIRLAGPGERVLSDHAALDVLVTVDGQGMGIRR